MLVINIINLSDFRVLMKRDVIFSMKNVAPATAAINYFNMLRFLRMCVWVPLISWNTIEECLSMRKKYVRLGKLAVYFLSLELIVTTFFATFAAISFH